MRRSVSFALATLLVLAFASPAAGGSTGWKVYTYNLTGAGPFTYYGEPGACPTPASVRLYFSSNGSMGSKKDWYSNFWWSRAPLSSQVLANGTLTITAKVSTGSWSNWNGQLDSVQTDGFNAAAASPALIGLSFGGGCFYENGVGASAPATFTLTSFTISGE